MDPAAMVAALREVTGVESDAECRHILEAHGWDLNAAVSTMLAASAADNGPGSGGSARGDDAGAAAALASSYQPMGADGQYRSAAEGDGPAALYQPSAFTAATLRSRGAAGGGGVGESAVVQGGGGGGGGHAPDGSSGGAQVESSHQWQQQQQQQQQQHGGTVATRPGGSGRTTSTAAAAAAAAAMFAAGGVGGNAAGGSPLGGGGGSRSFLARLVSLPLWLARGGVGAVTGTLAFSLWAAGGAASFLLTRIGSALAWAAAVTAALISGYPFSTVPRRGGRGALGGGSGSGGTPSITLPASAAFRQQFEAEYGAVHPEFFPGTFQEALRRAGEQFRFLLVYLHSAEHEDTPDFCRHTLASPALAAYVDERLVMWCADVARSTEGYSLGGRLQASTFPFCAVVTAAGSGRVALLRAIEGPVSATELISVLEAVQEERGAVLVAARADEEERQLSRRLREEQDAAYQAALLADQEKERKREEEERQRREEEEAAARLAREEEEARLAQERAEAAARQAVERRRAEAAAALQEQPEKGPDVTQVVIRLPGGERLERRFLRTASVEALYDWVDAHALGTFLPNAHYSLVSNFPRTVYTRSAASGVGGGGGSRSLQDVGLHPHASLFVQMEDPGDSAAAHEDSERARKGKMPASDQ